jgi:hypothetical protein
LAYGVYQLISGNLIDPEALRAEVHAQRLGEAQYDPP